ncbi:hypothetical protein D3C77_547310 [compost metagenome]
MQPVARLDRVQVFHGHLHRHDGHLQLLGNGVPQGAIGQRGKQAAMRHAVHVRMRVVHAQGQHAVGIAPVQGAQVGQMRHEPAAGAPQRKTLGDGISHGVES